MMSTEKTPTIIDTADNGNNTPQNPTDVDGHANKTADLVSETLINEELDGATHLTEKYFEILNRVVSFAESETLNVKNDTCRIDSSINGILISIRNKPGAFCTVASAFKGIGLAVRISLKEADFGIMTHAPKNNSVISPGMRADFLKNLDTIAADLDKLKQEA